MKFTVSSTKLLGHLQIISRVINSKNTMAILENFLFQLEGNTLTLTASDIETTLTTSVEVEQAEGDGCVAVTSKLLLDTLKEFSEQPLTFDINDGNLAMVIKSVNGSYNFIGLNGSEYPQTAALTDDARRFTIGSQILFEGINKTIFCTADNELRPVMSGILFDLKTEDITIVATDAHKLVRYTHNSVTTEEPANFILPKKPANLLKAILPKEGGEVEVIFDSKNTRFQLGNYTMVCRQIEGRFPNYNAVIPTNNTYRVVVDRLSLMNALKRVSVFSNQGSNLIKLAFAANRIHISAQDIDFSISAEETIESQYDGENINMGFKSSFLIEILNNINAPEVIFELTDPSRAGLILPIENEENEDLLMLLMPMLLNE